MHLTRAKPVTSNNSDRRQEITITPLLGIKKWISNLRRCNLQRKENRNTTDPQKTDAHSNPWITLRHDKVQATCKGRSLLASNGLSHRGDYQKLRRMYNFSEETTLWTIDTISNSRATILGGRYRLVQVWVQNLFINSWLLLQVHWVWRASRSEKQDYNSGAKSPVCETTNTQSCP